MFLKEFPGLFERIPAISDASNMENSLSILYNESVMGSPILPLLQLVDDETAFVRDEVRKKLLSYPDLEDEIRPHWETLSDNRQEILSHILREQRLAVFHRLWAGWFAEKPETARLEKACAAISFLESGEGSEELAAALDSLVADFKSLALPYEPSALMEFLFHRRLGGNDQDYYHPDHSVLARVLRSGKGLPISLVVIAILVGDRLGIQISGCNFPRHFLASAVWNGDLEIYDCYNGGRKFTPGELRDLFTSGPENGRELLRPARAEEMALRILRNLAVAKESRGDREAALFYQGLEKELGQLSHENE